MTDRITPAEYRERVKAALDRAGRRGKPRRPAVDHEHLEQVALCQWLDARGRKYFAVPNKGWRSYGLAAKMRAEGMRAGAPDLVLIDQWWGKSEFDADGGYRYRPVAIEMKRADGGVCSPAQLEMHAELRARGWVVVVAHGAQCAIDELERMGF